MPMGESTKERGARLPYGCPTSPTWYIHLCFFLFFWICRALLKFFLAAQQPSTFSPAPSALGTPAVVIPPPPLDCPGRTPLSSPVRYSRCTAFFFCFPRTLRVGGRVRALIVASTSTPGLMLTFPSPMPPFRASAEQA